MSSYTEKQRMRIANIEYSKVMYVGKQIQIKEGKHFKTIGYVSDVVNDGTGQNAYVITDKPTSSSASSVKQVTVLYRGSSANISMDAADDWLDNDIPAAVNILINNQSPTPQLLASSQTLKDMMAKYPKAQFDIYGHSLGSMDAQYAVANLSIKEQSRLSGGYFYEGPNIYNMLNDKQRDNVKALNQLNKTFNYVDTKDLVPLGYGTDKNTVGLYVKVLSKNGTGKIDQHMWGGYQFDDDGNVFVDPSVVSDYANVITTKKLSLLNTLKAKFMSGGSMTAGQKQLLDEYQAIALVEGMQTIVASQMKSLQMTYEQAIEEANALWQETVFNAGTIGQHLSHYEREAALDAGGVTEENVKTKPVSDYERSLDKLKPIQQKYQKLSQKINQAIKHQVKTDHELAGQIRGMLW